MYCLLMHIMEHMKSNVQISNWHNTSLSYNKFCSCFGKTTRTMQSTFLLGWHQ